MTRTAFQAVMDGLAGDAAQALLTASNGRELSGDAQDAFAECLGG